jgi:hypothetical protein
MVEASFERFEKAGYDAFDPRAPKLTQMLDCGRRKSRCRCGILLAVLRGESPAAVGLVLVTSEAHPS